MSASASSSSSTSDWLADASGFSHFGVSHLLSSSSSSSSSSEHGAPTPILQQSIDYVQNKQQFQLHSLLTEQRHSKTMNLSQTLSHSTASGLRQLFSVDADIPVMLQHLTQGTKDPLQYPQGATAATGQDTSRFESCLRLQQSLVRTLLTHRRVYVYGCGATGRLAKHFESAFWRPFWGRVMTDKKLSDIASVIKQKLSPTLLDDCVGEMTGADRALIASLEGFEDLQLIGALQLSEHGIKKGDVIITVTEGGETSSVIGTVLAGVKQWEEAGSSTASADEIRSHHYFLYNNPDHVLLPFDRSAAVIRDDRITKINLSTGPQAITGSTRMQATSSETFVLAAIFHVALEELFRVHLGLNAEQLSRIGFGEHKGTSAELLKQKLQEFDVILSTATASVDSLATFTDWETECYRQQHFTTYFAQKGLMSVFIDNTERSPTFRLFPLDRIDLKDRRNCLLQIWTKGSNLQEAWINFLGRPFCGMNYAHYEQPFLKEIKDEYLKEVAMRSLPQATNDQQELYDFSFSEENMRRRGGINHKGDLGCLVVLDEEIAELKEPNSAMCRFAQEFLKVDEAGEYNSRLEIMIITSPEHLVAHGFADVSSSAAAATEAFYNLPTLKSLPRARLHLTLFLLPTSLNDPLSIRSQLLTKLSLNAHSTAVMAKLGKVLGNFMVNVSPSNLKLIGRATHLILAQVNALADKYKLRRVSYPLANALLYDSIEIVKAETAKKLAAAASNNEPAAASATNASPAHTSPAGGTSAEVALSVVRILLAFQQQPAVSGDAALQLLNQRGLAQIINEWEEKQSK